MHYSGTNIVRMHIVSNRESPHRVSVCKSHCCGEDGCRDCDYHGGLERRPWGRGGCGGCRSRLSYDFEDGDALHRRDYSISRRRFRGEEDYEGESREDRNEGSRRYREDERSWSRRGDRIFHGD